MTEKQWIELVAPYAVNASRLYGYPASVLIAQSALETGYGQGYNCEVLVKWGNLLGMKADLLNNTWDSKWWDGRSATKQTPERYSTGWTTITDAFRVYAKGSDNGFQDCFNDYCQFMQDARYSKGGKYKYRDVLSMHGPATVIQTVSMRGYATDPAYAPSVMRIINKHDLTKYDKEGARVARPTIIANKNFGLHNSYQRTEAIKYLVIHYVGSTGGAKANVDYYNEPSTTNGSADFYVDFDGTAYGYNMDVKNRACWAVGGSKQSNYGGSLYKVATNQNCISIEMCVRTKGSKDTGSSDWYFEDATVEGAAKLAAYLLQEYAIPLDRLIRHYDVNGKHCPGVTGWIAPMGGEGKWNAFKERVKNIMGKTHSVIRRGSNGAEVRTWQKGLIDLGFADCTANVQSFVDGDFGANTEHFTKHFQRCNGLSVDGIVGEKSWAKMDELLAKLNIAKVNFTVEQFLAAAKARTNYYRVNKYIWESSTVAPWLDRNQKYTACDRSIDDYLNDVGLCVGNRNAERLREYLLEIGATEIKSVSQVKAGDIVFVRNMNHVFLCAGNNLRYDCGHTNRIQLIKEYGHYSEQPFNEPITDFYCAVRLPFVESKKDAPTPSETSSDVKFTLTVELVKKGSVNRYVGLVQSVLKGKGYYKGDIDNSFGDDTYKAVIAFQTDEIAKGNKIGGSDGKPDGICGGGTLRSLFGVDVKIVQ